MVSTDPELVVLARRALLDERSIVGGYIPVVGELQQQRVTFRKQGHIEAKNGGGEGVSQGLSHWLGPGELYLG